MPETSITLDLEHRQQDEISSISSIYGDIFKDITPTGLVWNKKPSPHFQVFLSSSNNPDPVSYTHLTLPTILRV